MTSQKVVLNRGISLGTCVTILNGIIKKHFGSYDKIKVGDITYTSLTIRLNKDSKKELGNIIFDEDDLENYMMDNFSENTSTLSITEIWEMIENYHRTKLSFDENKRELKILG